LAQKLDIFTRQLKHALEAPLPGKAAQDIMAATSRNVRINDMRQSGEPKPGAVLVLFYENEKGEICIPLMQRPSYEGAHSGQISLPGGKVEPEDDTRYDTALRECEEEIGIPQSKVEVIGELSELYIFASHYTVLPVVGYMQGLPEFIPDHIEVDKVIEAPVERLIDKNYHLQKRLQVRHFEIDAPYFDVFGEIVWGATAMMLSELVTVIEQKDIQKYLRA
jgi:8-oxo-dGTP pyrophosphatase MutT (NUDIX family)